MSSVQSAYAQVPTKKFVARTTGKAFRLAEIIASFPAGSVQQVGSVYLVDTAAHLANFVNTVGALTTPGSIALVVGETLNDMGTQFSVGIQGSESKFLTFRKVKTSKGATIAGLGDGWDGYVVVENNIDRDTESDLSDTPGNDLPCCVARV